MRSAPELYFAYLDSYAGVDAQGKSRWGGTFVKADKITQMKKDDDYSELVTALYCVTVENVLPITLTTNPTPW